MQKLTDLATLFVAEPANQHTDEGPSARLINVELCEAVLEHAEAMYIARPDGTLLYANSGYWQIVALAEGTPLAPHPDLPERHRGIADDVGRSGETRTTRENIGASPNVRHFSSRHFAVHDRKGKLIAVAGSFVENTRETEAVARASRERKRFVDVMRATSDWIWEIDADGNLTFVSDRITEALGLPSFLIKGRSLFSIGSFPGSAEQPNGVVASIEARLPFRDALVEITPVDGQKRIFHLSGVPVFDDAGVYRGYRGAGTDVTARIQAEDSARRSKRALESALEELTNKNTQLEVTAQRATAAKHAKDEFLATMSHELRTPLNAIIGFADLVKMQPFGELNERYLDYIGEVSQAGRHLLSLINDCLDVARLEMDSLPLHVGRVQLKEVLRDARAMIALRAEGKGINISEIGCDDDIVLNVDPTRCFQIFVNLLGNGVKFTPDGGAIGVDIVPVEHKNAVNVVVWDTGAGIPEESQDLIFDKFQQLHDDILSRVNEGVGLGLTLSRQFARLMGGNITVESTPGHGSRFSVQLPLAEPEDG